ncbi:unnamed protein product [Polarella glacialis]|uniref:SAP domain-containing protein n=1 Tax=Polarella glacialis TaxID=89957 RepID=A0A813JAI3_POLGL|nr:unnamed protein product [Polarella glacialis]CAE8672239.1 unnamed protein product [Polarella glacialis]
MAMEITTSANVFHADVRWRLNGYSLLDKTVGKAVPSPTFCHIGRNTYSLHAYLGGASETTAGQLGLFLHGDGPDTMRIGFDFFIINQDGGEEVFEENLPIHSYHGGKGFSEKATGGFSNCIGYTIAKEKWSFETGSRFVQNDQVVFLVKLKVIRDTLVQSEPLKETKPVSAVLACFGNLLAEGKHTDVMLSVGSGEFTQQIRAHRLVLSASSVVFEQMLFSSGMSEAKADAEIELADLDPRLAHNFIRSFYTDDIDAELWEDDESLCHLMSCFHKYQVKGMLKRCEDHIIKKFSVENVAERLMMADLLDMGSLRESALNFLVDSYHRLAEVQSTDGFARLTKQRPHLLADVLATAVQPAKRKSTNLAFEKLPTNLQDLRVVELKQLLSDRSLSTGGAKAALVERLQQHDRSNS